MTLFGLAYTYVKEGDLDQASSTIEKSYQDAVAGKLRADRMETVAALGAHIADLREDGADRAKWAPRADTTTATSPSPAAAAPKN